MEEMLQESQIKIEITNIGTATGVLVLWGKNASNNLQWKEVT